MSTAGICPHAFVMPVAFNIYSLFQSLCFQRRKDSLTRLRRYSSYKNMRHEVFFVR